MQRLTKRNSFGEVTVSGKDEDDINRKYHQIANRLAELEDKLESGRLVEFPRVRLLAEEGDDKLFSVEMRFNQRRRNGQFGRMSCVELGLIKESQVACRPMICGKCSYEWSPIIVTGKCPKCGNQEGHKFKEQKNG